MEYMMAKKARKRLGQDIKVKDVLLLDRPEVEVLEALKPTKKYHKAPEGQILLSPLHVGQVQVLAR
jgi:hypothetical protein